jgi:hypothetical protein
LNLAGNICDEGTGQGDFPRRPFQPGCNVMAKHPAARRVMIRSFGFLVALAMLALPAQAIPLTQHVDKAGPGQFLSGGNSPGVAPWLRPPTFASALPDQGTNTVTAPQNGRSTTDALALPEGHAEARR